MTASMNQGKMTYAVYTDDPHYYLALSADSTRTLCGLSTKGSRRNVQPGRGK